MSTHDAATRQHSSGAQAHPWTPIAGWPRRHEALRELLALARRHAGIAAILLLASALDFYRLQDSGYGNIYYAAAVRSMLTSWHNFFFVSFDPGGFISIDKPPLGFWIQAASAKLLGFSGFSLLLPQALAGVGSVLIVYLLVRRVWGQPAALIAALILATTPISVATNRNNTIDSLLTLVLLLAIWAVGRASERASRGSLLLGFALVGVGFNIKMLQAYLVLPALYAVYLLASPCGWRRRLRDLTLATMLLLATSLAWILAVEATPAAERPFVGGSSGNHVLGLIYHHNGLARLVGDPGAQGAEIGSPGPLRFLEHQFAGQISWFLPLAIAAVLLFLASRPWRQARPFDRQTRALILWGAYLITLLVCFSVLTFFHLYYLVMIAPAIAVLAAAGLYLLWGEFQRPGWRAMALPLTLGSTLALHVWIVSSDADWAIRIVPPVLILGSASIVGLAVTRLRSGTSLDNRLTRLAVGLALLGLLIGPSAWAAMPAVHARGTFVPIGGPEALRDGWGVTMSDASVDPREVQFLEAHRDGARYLAATLTSFTAAPLILATGEPVMNVGGYRGRDPAISVTGLQAEIRNGTVRFFLIPDGDSAPTGNNIHPADLIASWVRKNCLSVPEDRWRSPSEVAREVPTDRLYDCSVLATSADRR